MVAMPEERTYVAANLEHSAPNSPCPSKQAKNACSGLPPKFVATQSVSWLGLSGLSGQRPLWLTYEYL
jgi:hypothetical protein